MGLRRSTDEAVNGLNGQRIKRIERINFGSNRMSCASEFLAGLNGQRIKRMERMFLFCQEFFPTVCASGLEDLGQQKLGLLKKMKM
jgi:hypothetical protein